MIYLIWIVALLLALVFYLRNVYSYFDRYGIKHFKPLPVLGNMLEVVKGNCHLAEQLEELCNAFPDERFVGKYDFINPTIIIKDLELIKKIAVKDFDNFLHRGTLVDEDAEPIFGRSLFSLKGQEWKDMRSTLSPAFTSSKMRSMMPFMVEINEQMIEMLKKRIRESDAEFIDVECKDVTTRYANDVIASCAFGMKLNSHTDENNLFYTMGRSIATFGFKAILVILGYQAIPDLMTKFKVRLFSENTTNFFIDIVLSTMRDRELRKLLRPDMIHLLMEAKKGKLKHEDKILASDSGFASVEESEFGTKTVLRDWSDIDLVAQAVLFLIAGFETVSTTMSFLLYELALHPEVQDKLYQEIEENEAKNGGKLDYTSIQNLKYLDMILSEVLRLWPPVIGLSRESQQNCNIGKPNPGAKHDFILRKGKVITIPVWSIHRNPEYYPEPAKFDPERFSDANKDKIKPLTYMPFGAGPRNCIGSRFALCEVKVMAYELVKHFEISSCQKTTYPPKLNPSTFNVILKDGCWLRMKNRT